MNVITPKDAFLCVLRCFHFKPRVKNIFLGKLYFQPDFRTSTLLPFDQLQTTISSLLVYKPIISVLSRGSNCLNHIKSDDAPITENTDVFWSAGFPIEWGFFWMSHPSITMKSHFHTGISISKSVFAFPIFLSLLLQEIPWPQNREDINLAY